MDKTYLGNPNLKAANQKIRFTKKQVREFLACQENPVYFIENYIKEDVIYFEKKNKIKININTIKDLNLSEYKIDFKSKSKKILKKIEKYENLQKIIIDKKDKKTNLKKTQKNIINKRKLKKKKFINKKSN